MNVNAMLIKTLGWIVTTVILGAIAWATWVSVALYEIKAAVSELKGYDKRIEHLEAAIWPRDLPRAWGQNGR